MDPHRNAGREHARLSEISRRAIIAGTPAAALASSRSVVDRGIASPGPVVAADEGVDRLKRWLALDGKIERLQDRWTRLEGWLVREHSWFGLSPAAQQALPGARELRDIEGCIDTLTEKRDSLLTHDPDSRSPSLEAIVVRLAVAERLIWPDDHPEAHGLIAAARRGLVALVRDSA